MAEMVVTAELQEEMAARAGLAIMRWRAVPQWEETEAMAGMDLQMEEMVA